MSANFKPPRNPNTIARLLFKPRPAIKFSNPQPICAAWALYWAGRAVNHAGCPSHTGDIEPLRGCPYQIPSNLDTGEAQVWNVGK
jgi:hypothetical protein